MVRIAVVVVDAAAADQRALDGIGHGFTPSRRPSIVIAAHVDRDADSALDCAPLDVLGGHDVLIGTPIDL